MSDGVGSGQIGLCPHQGCGFACCSFQQGNYIVTYPGELAAARAAGQGLGHLEVVDAGYHGGERVVCHAADCSNCDGGYKPLDCASYPFFPTLQDGRVTTLIKGRKCPLPEHRLGGHRAWVLDNWNALLAGRRDVADWMAQVELVGYAPSRSDDAPPAADMAGTVNPRLVAVCGIDGAGKTTLIRTLGEDPLLGDWHRLQKRDRSNVRTVEAQKNGLASADIAASPFGALHRLSHGFDFLTFYEEEYLPAKTTGGWIISDRWSLCTVAYGNAGFALADDLRFLTGTLDEPGLTLFLDIEPQAAVDRVQRRGAPQADERLDILEQFAAGYRSCPPPAGKMVRLSAGSPEGVFAEAKAAILEHVRSVEGSLHERRARRQQS